MLTRILALTLALLTLTAPANATTIAVEDINLDFGNGYKEIGTLGVHSSKFTFITQAPDVYFNGSLVPTIPFSTGEAGKLYQFGGVDGFLLTFPGNYPGLPVSWWTLNGVPAVSGTVDLVSLSYVPLPAALPLFGTALAGLGGAGWIKRRRKFSRYRSA
jgi:hypothetical protein